MGRDQILRGGGGRVHREAARAVPVKDERPTLWCSSWEARDPSFVASARLIESLGIATVCVLAPGLRRPDKQLLITAAEHLSRSDVQDALAVVAPIGSGVVVRDPAERPTLSAEYSRQRGFSDEQIRAELEPWVAQQKVATQAEVDAKQKALDDAVAARDAALRGETEKFFTEEQEE